MYAHGLSTRDIEAMSADAEGRSLLNRTAVNKITERLWAEYEAFASSGQVDAAILPFLRRQRRSPSAYALAYNLGNFRRTLAMRKAAELWSLNSLREKLIKIGAKVVSHGRYVTFQMAEVAVPRQMFREILMLIARIAGAARSSMKEFGGRKA
jgi:hypothetical protein